MRNIAPLNKAENRLLTIMASIFWNLVSLRTVLVALGLSLIFLSERPSVFDYLDRKIASQFASPEQQNAIKDIHLPKAFELIQSKQDDTLSTIGGLAHSIFSAPSMWWQDELSPSWFRLLEGVLIIALCAILTLGLARLSNLAGFAVVTSTAAMMLAIQVVLIQNFNLWYPFGTACTLLLSGYCLMLFWLRPAQEITALRTKNESLSLAHAKLLLQNGEYQKVLTTLEKTTPKEEVLELVYQSALEQEQTQQHSDALLSYEFIQSKKSRFRDVKTRVAQLKGETTRSTAANLEQTVALETNIRPLKLGRYQVERELGRGAMGIVYLGRDPKIARPVAIKTLNIAQLQNKAFAEIKERFFREAEAAGRLNHPGIVTVYDVGEESNLAYIAMDLIQGDSLEHYCRQDKLLSVNLVYHIILKVAEAMEYAHQRQVIHRDIKPSNLIFNKDTQDVKVSDFGIARLSDDSKTRTGHVMGSPLYMSPEQLRGKPVQGASDIFSLGATFYQLLCGQTPFIAENLPELTMQIINKKHKSVREIRPQLPASAVRITNKALSKEPSKRYASMSEMAEQIRKALHKDFRERVA